MKNKVSYLLETIEKDLRSAVEGGERVGSRAGKLGAIPYRPLDQFIHEYGPSKLWAPIYYPAAVNGKAQFIESFERGLS